MRRREHTGVTLRTGKHARKREGQRERDDALPHRRRKNVNAKKKKKRTGVPAATLYMVQGLFSIFFSIFSTHVDSDGDARGPSPSTPPQRVTRGYVEAAPDEQRARPLRSMALESPTQDFLNGLKPGPVGTRRPPSLHRTASISSFLNHVSQDAGGGTKINMRSFTQGPHTRPPPLPDPP